MKKWAYQQITGVYEGEEKRKRNRKKATYPFIFLIKLFANIKVSKYYTGLSLNSLIKFLKNLTMGPK